MRRTLFFRTAALLALTGCSGIDVTTTQDPKTDFSPFRTWAWWETVNNDAPDPDISELGRRRIKNCISSELEAKGYAWGPADKADMLVKWVAAAGGSVELAPVGFRFGVDDPATSGETRGPSNIAEGTLVIDVLSNTPPRRIIWRGVAEATVNRSLPDEERQKRIQKSVTKLLASFPSQLPK